MTAPLQNLLITVNVVALEKVSFSDTEYRKTVCYRNTLSADDNHYLLNTDNLTQPIQMRLYEKHKTISEFFSGLSKICIQF